MSLLKSALFAAALTFAGAGAASAQTFGSLNVTTGFSPDPLFVEIPAGGSVDTRQVSGGSCAAGFVADAPDFSINYAAGQTLPLILSAWSSVDVTLFVLAPNGQYFCDDDGGTTGFSAMIGLSNPVSGRYDVWVGTYNQQHTGTTALLSISELDHF